MPILAAEPSIHPERLLETPDEISAGRSWWAVYTRARQEKALARQLLALRIPFYLPLVQRESLIRRRRVRSFVPLFGGYLFLLGTESERVKCLTTNRVAQTLPVADGEQLASDLKNIQQLILADAPLTIERQLKPGRQVRVKAGSLAGLEGTIITQRGKSRLVVAVQMLQQGVSMEIENFLLEPID